jgi:hypothetical protein
MKYYASDIIKKARIAADLVNSDFINWYEETSILNDVYDILYQDLIEINDPAFVKVLETTDKVIQLPDDFYQLRCVTLVRNGFSTPILRRSFSESYNSMSYEILDNELHVNTPYVQSPPDGVYHIEYFAAPITLLFPPKKVELKNIAHDYKVLCSNDKYIIKYREPAEGKDPDDYSIYVSDYDYNLIKKLGCPEVTYASITDKYLTIKTEEQLMVFDLSDPTLGTKYTVNVGDFNVITTEDGAVYFINDKKEVFDISDTTTAIRVLDDWSIYLDDSLNFTNNSAYFTDNTWQDCWYIDNEKIVHFDEEILYESGRNIVIKQPLYRNECLYGKSGDNFVTINGDNTYYTKRVPNLQSIGVLNTNTGLSLLSYSTNGGNLESWVNDILLNYPNSFFFQVMVYALAVQYKIKQGADASGLQAIYEGYYKNFMNSLPQDVYMPSRINNVYTY